MESFETERLILQHINLSDMEAIYRSWVYNPEIYRFLAPYYANDSDTARKWIDETLQDFSEANPGSWELFAIELKSANEVIGVFELTGIDREVRSAEVGYHLGKKWWGNGYAAEALRALLMYCFENAALNRVSAYYDPRNPNSGRVMQKAGMIYEGVFRQCQIRRGELVDRVYYAMLKEDWDMCQRSRTSH